jgi:hypothetical protein
LPLKLGPDADGDPAADPCGHWKIRFDARSENGGKLLKKIRNFMDAYWLVSGKKLIG